jgi:hypothetical protein
MIIPLGATMAEQRDHERILAPGIIDGPLPAFPPGAAGDIDTHVCAEIVVTADGDVGTIVQRDDYPGCEPLGSGLSQLLFPSVADRLATWQFFAGGICTYLQDERECERPGARIERLAMKLSYAIHFARTNGEQSVSRSASLPDTQRR